MSIFNKSLCEWNDDQLELINWCAYYHNVLIDEKRPDDYTYENDLLLDIWVKEKEHAKKHRAHGGKSASDHQEVINFGRNHVR